MNIKQGWFDENTRQKIHVLGNLTNADGESNKELATLISRENLPKSYGGDFDWDFFDEPDLDDEARNVIGEMPKGPWIFEDGKVMRPKEYRGVDLMHVKDNSVTVATVPDQDQLISQRGTASVPAVQSEDREQVRPVNAGVAVMG